MTREQKTKLFYSEVYPHLATVLRTAKFLTRREDEAEDLTQETMIKAFNGLESFKPGTNMQHWLMAILRNTRIDRLRAGAKHQQDVAISDDFDLPDPSAPAPHEAAGTDELLNALSDQTIIDALQELPEEIRWTLLLVDVHGQELADAAAILGVPTGTVKSRCFRGRAMLREKLAGHVKESGYFRV